MESIRLTWDNSLFIRKGTELFVNVNLFNENTVITANHRSQKIFQLTFPGNVIHKFKQDAHQFKLLDWDNFIISKIRKLVDCSFIKFIYRDKLDDRLITEGSFYTDKDGALWLLNHTNCSSEVIKSLKLIAHGNVQN